MKIPVCFNKKMAVDSQGYSPSSGKSIEIMHAWAKEGLISSKPCQPATMHELMLAHSQAYATQVVGLKQPNGHGNKDKDVTEATLWHVGSMVAAAEMALYNEKVACSPSSGFHHAGFDYGGGFCTFNGLMVAARKILLTHAIGKIGIVDCDWHFGDGTQDIIYTLGLGKTIPHYTLGRHKHASAKDALESIQEGLEEMADCGLILYQAGADAHINDPLGGIFTSSEMVKRDKLVFDFCKRSKIPVAWNLAGGYQRSKSGGIGKVVSIHLRTMRQCVLSFST